MRILLVLTSLLLPISSALAQSATPGGMPPPPGMSMANSTAMRFPQPVKAGQLLNSTVVLPRESQDYVGKVHAVVRSKDGTVRVVIRHGGFLGWGGRLIAVPLEAMVLSGADMEVVMFTPDQLDKFPTFVPGTDQELAPEENLKVGLAKPSH